MNKIEYQEENAINELRWKTINHFVEENDVILYGDIKSHNIVKKNENSKLNRNFNDMKFYTFKSCLEYKMKINNKLLYLVNEAYTTKTCSNCGKINNPKASKAYELSQYI